MCCTNSYYTICMIKKWNKNSHRIPTHALITDQLINYQLAVLLTELLSYFIIYDHNEILHRKTIRKMRLYKFILVFHIVNPFLHILCLDFVVPNLWYPYWLLIFSNLYIFPLIEFLILLHTHLFATSSVTLSHSMISVVLLYLTQKNA